MRKAMVLLLSAAAASGCASYEYADGNTAVDANPACASRADRPGEPVSRDCERKAAASWNSRRERAPVDFGRKPRDD